MSFFIVKVLLVINTLFMHETPKVSNHFNLYMKNFMSHDLPISLNRLDIFQLSKYNESNHKCVIVEEKYLKYIPNEIIGKPGEHTFRCVYSLPSKNDISFVIIAKDYLMEDEYNEKLELFIVSYRCNGEILGCKEIAGFQIDRFEKSFIITEDYVITSLGYVYKQQPEGKYRPLHYMIETKTVSRIKENGEIIETSEAKSEGYFEESEEGYKYTN